MDVPYVTSSFSSSSFVGRRGGDPNDELVKALC
jgi:hypothetical protein